MRRGIPIFILAALLAVAARPLWSAQFLFSYDGPLHLLRVYALDLTLRQGIIYPRWLPDLLYGYGYPIFNFYPPFSAYAAETVHLFGIGFAEAVKLTFTATIAASLLGAYMMGAELFAGEPYAKAIGILTAVAYVFFPYFMVGIYTRGALAEAFAAALMPWLIWSLHRMLVRQTSSSLLLVGLLLSILLLSHSLTAAITAPLFAVYVVFEALRLPAAIRIKALALAAATAILGAGLASFYWLPFVAELPLVKMGSGMGILEDVFESNFLKPSALIQPSWFYDYGGPPVPLGFVASALGALALLGAVLTGKRLKERGTILFFGTVAVVGSISIAEPARALWLAFPFSSMIQSVWRMELLVNLGIAVLIGSLPILLSALMPIAKLRLPLATAWLQWAPLGLAALIAFLLIWTTVAALSPAQMLLPPNLFYLAHLARFEVSGASPGTTTFGEYMPLTVKTADLVNYTAQKIEGSSASTPEISLLRHDGTDWLFDVSTPDPVSIPMRAFFFPDWRATVDGNPARVSSSTPMGLLTVDVPNGNHQVRLSVGTTSARQIGILVSGVTSLIAIGLIAYAIRRRDPDLWIPLIVIAMLLAVILLPAMAALTSTPRLLQAERIRIPTGFDLIGLSVDDAQLDNGTWRLHNPSEEIHLQVYWQVRSSGLSDNPITWRLTSEDGRVWAQRAQYPRYGTALQRSWVLNEIIQDQYDLPLSEAIPPGRYSLQVSAAPQQPFLTSGRIDLAGSSPGVSPLPQPAHRLNALLGDQIRLVGYDAPSNARPGQPFDLTLYWMAEHDVLEDYTASAQLLDPDGKLVAQHDSITGDGINPTSLWTPGKPVAERRQIDLPRDLKPGSYSLIALMYNLRDLKRLSVVTDIGPSPDNAVVLGQVQLLGYSPLSFLGLASPFASNP